MVALLDGLEAKGLVTRRPQEGDRRRNVVELTAKGQGILGRATEASDVAERALVSSLSARDAQQLRKLLQAIAGES
jgi:DNA-binding MarR family transcriptional regulator